jgi:hypothetical protein
MRDWSSHCSENVDGELLGYDIIPCGLVGVRWRFGETCLCLQNIIETELSRLLAFICMGKELAIPIAKEDGLAPEPIWTLWKGEKPLAPAGNRVLTAQTVARGYTDQAIPASRIYICVYRPEYLASLIVCVCVCVYIHTHTHTHTHTYIIGMRWRMDGRLSDWNALLRAKPVFDVRWL